MNRLLPLTLSCLAALCLVSAQPPGVFAEDSPDGSVIAAKVNAVKERFGEQQFVPQGEFIPKAGQQLAGLIWEHPAIVTKIVDDPTIPARLIFLSHAAATLYMTGLIWFVQIVHYPLMGAIGNTEFSAYEQSHMSLATWVVGPPMLVEAATTVLLFWFHPTDLSISFLWAGVMLLAIIWISTAFLQVPCHESLSSGFDVEIHRRLVSTNWIRTVAWSLRGLLALWMIWITWKAS